MTRLDRDVSARKPGSSPLRQAAPVREDCDGHQVILVFIVVLVIVRAIVLLLFVFVRPAPDHCNHLPSRTLTPLGFHESQGSHCTWGGIIAIVMVGISHGIDDDIDDDIGDDIDDDNLLLVSASLMVLRYSALAG